MKTKEFDTRRRSGWREQARIIWAVTSKDLVEALKNKNTLTLLVIVVFMAFFYRYMPEIYRYEIPILLVYDPGESSLVPLIENSQALKIVTFKTEKALFEEMGDAEELEIGLVIPDDFDSRLQAGDVLQVEGYFIDWYNEQQKAEVEQLVVAELGRLVGRAVAVHTDGNIVYRSATSIGGISLTATMAVVFALIMTGLLMIPHLFLEEKNTRTLEALLVSPASAWHVVAGKALAGLFYCILAGTGALLVFSPAVVHWPVAVLGVVTFGLCTTAIGLWLGIKIESRAQLSVWTWPLVIPLFIPMVMVLFEDLLPAWVINVMQFFPSVSAGRVFGASYALEYPLGTTLLWAGWTLLCTGGVLLLVRRQVLAINRGEGGFSFFKGEAGEPAAGSQVGSLFGSLFAGRKTAGVAPVEAAEQPAAYTYSLAATTAKAPGWAGIVSAIARKDLKEALKNRLFVSLLIGTSIMFVTSLLLPLLVRMSAKPTVFVYDQGRSMIIRGLAGQETMGVRLVDSQEELESGLTEYPETAIGLVIPADYDSLAGVSSSITLEGYTVHWTDGKKNDELVAFFEEQLSAASWAQVAIDLEGHEVYPEADVGGQPGMMVQVISMVLVTLGAALVPLLVLEEKEAHTLEMLRVSPAGLGQILSGKALAGLVFLLASAALMVVLSASLYVHWFSVLLAVLLGAAFAVSMGLLIGIISDNPTSMGVWSALVVLGLVMPSFLMSFGIGKIPPALFEVVRWMPVSTMINLLRMSMVRELPLVPLLLNTGALALAALLMMTGIRITRRKLGF